MTTLNRMLERNQAANLLALQGALRLGGLTGIGMLGLLHKALETYLVCLRHGADLTPIQITDSPERLVANYADAMIECVEKSWQDFRNNMQIWLLTQDEALIWLARIDRALATA
jgi:hypothetical protein